MGIVNATPDSFFNQGRNSSISEIISMAEKMVQEGARVLDIGGMSSRPRATEISEQEEIDRVIPVIEALHKHLPDTILSIDTYRPPVAEHAIQQGVSIINDISGGAWHPEMLTIAHKHKTPFICMHMLGKPQTMQNNPQYENVLKDIYDFFYLQILNAKEAGVQDIIVDPGFGFGKSIQHNYKLLHHLELFTSLERPILVGLSRKSMIYKVLQTDAEHGLNGTTALHMIALQNGANILRVHDVKEAQECIALFSYLQSTQ